VRPSYIKVLAIGSLGNIVVSSLGNVGSVLSVFTADRSIVDLFGVLRCCLGQDVSALLEGSRRALGCLDTLGSP
jgi:hypothetical protein